MLEWIAKILKWIVGVVSKIFTYLKYIKYLYYVLMIILVKLFTPNMLLGMVSLDGLYSSIHSIVSYIKNTDETQKVSVRPIYKHPILDRYICYTIHFITYKMLCWVFWIPDSTMTRVFSYLSMLTVIPHILNNILNSYTFQKIKKGKKDIIKTISSKQMANLVQFFSKTYLDKEVTIDYKEILPLFDNYDVTVSYLQSILKNTVITSLLNFLKIYAKKIYYKTVKYIYIYKTGDGIKSFNPNTARKALETMIENKNWGALLDTSIYNAIICLYQENTERVDIFGKLWIILRNKIAKLSAIYTVASFFSNPMLIPILSAGLYLCSEENRRIIRKNIIKYAIYLACVPYCYTTGSYILTSLICQFGYNFIENSAVSTTVSFICNTPIQTIQNICSKNKQYSIFIPAMLIYTVYSSFHLPLILVVDDPVKICVYITFQIANYMSGTNIMHLICSAGIVYVIVGYREHIPWPQFVDDSIAYMDALVESYKKYITTWLSKLSQTRGTWYVIELKPDIMIQSHYMSCIREFPDVQNIEETVDIGEIEEVGDMEETIDIGSEDMGEIVDMEEDIVEDMGDIVEDMGDIVDMEEDIVEDIVDMEEDIVEDIVGDTVEDMTSEDITVSSIDPDDNAVCRVLDERTFNLSTEEFINAISVDDDKQKDRLDNSSIMVINEMF